MKKIKCVAPFCMSIHTIINRYIIMLMPFTEGNVKALCAHRVIHVLFLTMIPVYLLA